MKVIPVKIRNKNASKPMLVDNWDYEILKKRKWTDNGFGYAASTWNYKQHSAQKIIMWCPEGYELDHINGNTLDNRKENLRICTRTQNSFNKPKPSSNTSGYKGVSWSKFYKKWHAQISAHGKPTDLGFFKDKKDAARAYNKAAKKLHGDYAYQNDL